jgi:hypothetical protein
MRTDEPSGLRPQPLPRGVTGFFAQPDSLPHVDPKLFKAACHVAARNMGAPVRMFEHEGRTSSYLAAVFDGARIAALCNRFHPYLGFVATDALPVGGGAVFLHSPPSSSWPGFRVLDPDFLNAELNQGMLSALAPCERDQIRYWKPTKLGNVIFNVWD